MNKYWKFVNITWNLKYNLEISAPLDDLTIGQSSNHEMIILVTFIIKRWRYVVVWEHA